MINLRSENDEKLLLWGFASFNLRQTAVVTMEEDKKTHTVYTVLEFDLLIDFRSVRGLTQTHQIRLCSCGMP